jgi:hypothetical protein
MTIANLDIKSTEALKRSNCPSPKPMSPLSYNYVQIIRPVLDYLSLATPRKFARNMQLADALYTLVILSGRQARSSRVVC